MILGIDYGSKMAGTTVIANLYEHNKVEFYFSKKNQDADQFILDFVKANKNVWLIYLDAPLSLPAIYSDSNAEPNYFYRKADVETKAMSPMFLGGLTARAMKLKSELNRLGIKVVETYPGKLAELIGLKEIQYKKDKSAIRPCLEIISEKSKLATNEEAVINWHHLDALLCLYSAKRHETGNSIVFGEEKEGQIIV